MALLSNVPNLVFTDNGVVAPTSQQILDGVLLDFDTAYGGNLNLSLNTPQGQLATSLTAIIEQKNAAILFLVNQFNPIYASGLFQDALGEIYNLTRKPGVSTLVTCTLTGLENTIIPAGTLAKDISGNTYSCVSTVTIGASGSVSAEFANVIIGNIPCPPNTLTVIFQSIAGWSSINNPAAGVNGSQLEDRQDFEYRRLQSVAANAQGTLLAIQGAVFSVTGILDVLAVDNPSSTPLVIFGTTLVGHSLFVCAYATTWTASLEQQVAQQIFNKKNPGCAYNGDTTVIIYQESIPYPVTFQEAAPIQIYFEVNIVNALILPNNIAQLIQDAIFASFDEKIGALISANTYYGTILAVNPNIQINSAFVGIAPNPITPTYQMEITEKPLIQQANIIVNLV